MIIVSKSQDKRMNWLVSCGLIAPSEHTICVYIPMMQRRKGQGIPSIYSAIFYLQQHLTNNLQYVFQRRDAAGHRGLSTSLDYTVNNLLLSVFFFFRHVSSSSSTIPLLSIYLYIYLPLY